MFQSKSNILFKNKQAVQAIFEKTLKGFETKNNHIIQENLLHKTEITMQESTADIVVSFGKKFYILYLLILVFFLILPKETAFIWSSALAAFVIFSTVMYFSLDYKVKTILDAF